ncbi:virulence protein RhuM/Fic/DOC family protein [Desulfolithobacter dissulfuricans]|nr:virulence protein RhuM/Fic/DOC family protein [Desulfolithobacter dissulfuricans]
MAELFGRDKSVISRHLRNIFQTGELVKESVVAKNATTAADGKTYQVDWYNLDAIISVGYRVNSKRGTRFRIWATSVLKDHLVKGYTLNERRLAEKGTSELQEVLSLLSSTLETHGLVNDEGRAVLEIVSAYAATWNLLLQYDEDRLALPAEPDANAVVPDPYEARAAIAKLKNELLSKGEASDLFGQERGEGLAAILGAVGQSFGGHDLYPGVALKAAHLLYFVIKDHPFSDGNKRIGAFLFLLFLRKNRLGVQRRFSNNALVALTLLIAASDPGQKEILVRLITHLITGE